MKVKLNTFMGRVPILADKALPPGAATVAEGLRFDDRSLKPIKAEVTVHTFLFSVADFVLHEGVFLGFPSRVDAAPGPIAADRLYYTGDGVPKMYVPGSGTYDLALPPPADAPTLIVQGTVNNNEDGVPTPPLETIGYTYTYVTAFGEESQPAPISALVQWQEGQTVYIAGFTPVAPGRNISNIRVYRSQTSASGITDLYFVKELPITSLNWTHDLATDPIQEFITSRDFDPPPDDLQGLTSMPNGMMAAFRGRELFFCEPYIPHAWPSTYTLTTDYPIVALVSFGMTLAVLTEGTPYIVQGQAPEQMVMQQVEANMPCASAASVVDLGYMAAYATPDGLVTISQAGPQMISASLFGRDQWRDLDPSSVIGGQINGRYVMTWDNGIESGTYVIDLSGSQPFLVEDDIRPVAMAHDIKTGRLLYLAADQRAVRSWDDKTGAPTTYTWRSGVLEADSSMTFGAFKVWAKDYGSPAVFEVKIIADGQTIATETEANAVHRLPDGRADEWQVEITSNMRVTDIVVAGTPGEVIL